MILKGYKFVENLLKMKKTYLLIALFSTFFGFSQFNSSAPWMKNADEADSKEKKLSELVTDFNDYWSTRDKTKRASGYKPFMRWVEKWKNVTNDQGYVISQQELMAVWEQKNQAKRNGNATSRLVPTSNWQPIGPTQNSAIQTTRGRGRINVICVDPSDPNTIYFGAPAGGIWKTTNSGASWVPLFDEFAQIGVSGIAVAYNNPNIVYIATGDKDANDSYSIGIYKSINGGTSWSPTGLTLNNTSQGLGDLVIHPTNPNILWCATSTGIKKTTDGGITWTTATITGAAASSFTQGSLRLKPGNPDIIYASTATKIYKSINAGVSFIATGTGFPISASGRTIIDVTAANPEIVYCLKSKANSHTFVGLFKSIDGGATYTNTGLTASATDVFDGGTQAWYDMALCVSQTDPNEVYTGLLNVWKSSDGGATATKLNNWASWSPNFTHADIHFLQYFGDKLYCGSDGGIYVSTDKGTTFNDIIGQAQIGQFYKISVSKQSASKVTGGLQDNGGFIFNNNLWRSYHAGDGMDTAIDPTNSNKCYGFVYNGGTLFQSNDSGMTLSLAVDTPTGEVGDWVTPLRANSVGEIFAGYAKLYKLTNGAWVAQNTLAFGTGNIQNVSVDPSNDNIMYVSKGSTLYKSTNRGVAFTQAFIASGAITSISVHYTNSNIVYITTAGTTTGNAFKSTNGGTAFTAIATGLPNVGKNIIVHQGRHTLNPLYVGTTVGVYYIDDSMTAWAPFETNLPNTSVADLEINLDDSKIIAGTYGRGVWQCDIPVQVPTSDVKFVGIQSPTGTIACGGLISPQITVKNNGSAAISSVSIAYNYNGTPQSYTWNGSLAPATTQSIDLPSFTITTRGAYSLSVTTTTSGDAFPDNNQGATPFYVNDSGTAGVVNTFETPTSSLLTYTDGLTTSQWQRGVRVAGALASGSGNVYTTSFSGNYPDETKAYLVSQCYDFSYITNPVIKFKMAFDLEPNWDVVYVQYSLNFGQSWTVLGTQGATWYNSNRTAQTAGNDCYNCPGAQWTSPLTGADLSLKEYSYPLNSLVGNPNVIFRIVFHSDQGLNQLGVVVDDFVIEGTLANQQFEMSNIAIYPNPSKGIFNVSMGSIKPKTVNVYDLTGKIVYSKSEFLNNPSQFLLDLSSISSGIYFVKIDSDNQSVTKRIIKN
ncbi:Secretion system C-terminal sorting domain [Flavobacteriaceae bacterium]